MAGKSLARLKGTLQAGLDLLFPRACMVCNARLSKTDGCLCPACASQVSVVKGEFCPKCGSLLEDANCQNCQHTQFSFEFSRAALDFRTPVTDLVHRLKYDGYRSPADYLADMMNESLAQYPEFKDYPLILAVPLHLVRKRERGYNQSVLIAKKLARLSGKSYINPVKRKRYTQSQTWLEREQRLKNLAGAFRVQDSGKIRGQNVIVIDDVFTTGSTLNELSRELYKAGAAKVAGFTATRA